MLLTDIFDIATFEVFPLRQSTTYSICPECSFRNFDFTSCTGYSFLAIKTVPLLHNTVLKIATNPKHESNRKEKHEADAKLGWYRYDIRFSLPVYDDKTGKVARHNIYSASMLVRHADDGKKYLYDILAIKKETSSPLE